MEVLAIEQKEKNGEGRGGYYLEKKIFGLHRGGEEDQRRKRWRKISRRKIFGSLRRIIKEIDRE